MAEDDWTLGVAPSKGGVRLEIGLNALPGGPVAAAIVLDRAEARRLAKAILAASGDAAERTFPHPAPTPPAGPAPGATSVPRRPSRGPRR